MDNTDTVCAVVVTFNRKELLIECLNALMIQERTLEGIYIIDNASSDGTSQLLKENNFLDTLPPNNLDTSWEHDTVLKNMTIHYVRMSENTGGSGGFYEGVRRGYEKGYDWLWLMDDDIEMANDTLKVLMHYSLLNESNIVLMPARFYENHLYTAEAKILNYKNPFKKFCSHYINSNDLTNEYFEIATFPFEGPLISKKVVEKIGMPKQDLFIFSDDTYYATKVAVDKTLVTYMVSQAKLFKKLSSSDEKFSWKTYYALRNMIVLDQIFGENILVKQLRPMLLLFYFLIKYKIRFRTLKYLFKAFYDGKRGRLGKTVSPGEI